MSPSTRSILAVVAVLVVAGAAYWAWNRFLSHAHAIDTIHAACLAEFDDGAAKAKAATSFGGPFREFSAGVGRLIDEAKGSVAEATCTSVREACRIDFDGEFCRRARARYL